MEKITHLKHDQNITFYLLSNVFERAGYYGIRALALLYILSEMVDAATPEGLAFLTLIFSLSILGQLIGAVVGDLVMSNKKALILGGLLQAIAAFMLSIHSISTLFIGFIVLVLGTGFYKPNMVAHFGKQYLQKTKLLDSGFSFLAIAINVGSFLGVTIIGYCAGIEAWSYGFMIAGLFFISSILMLVFTKDKTAKITVEKNGETHQNSIKIILAMVLICTFWALYSIGYEGRYQLERIFIEKSPIEIAKSATDELLLCLIIPIGLFSGILWRYYYMNRFVKITIGLLFGALSFLILFLIPEVPNQQYFYLFLMSIFFFGIAEMLISPTVYGLLTKHSSPKYLAIMISLLFVSMKLFDQLTVYIKSAINNDGNSAITIASIGLLSLAVIVGIGLFIRKKHFKNNVKS